ncbi:unnamed protein product, partial [Strongylus vulgaris]
HDGQSEFREVPEIAEAPNVTTESFPYISLRYSKVFKIKELGDATSMAFMKWRCTLSSNTVGHVDDVLEFPTVHMLKIHALNHFRTYHDGFFDTSFLDYEWELLKKELPSSATAFFYSPLACSFNGEPFDTTNPNHFNAPFKADLLPRLFQEVQVCGFCFWCGYPSQFLNHILCHGYIDTGLVLSARISLL